MGLFKARKRMSLCAIPQRIMSASYFPLAQAAAAHVYMQVIGRPIEWYSRVRGCDRTLRCLGFPGFAAGDLGLWRFGPYIRCSGLAPSKATPDHLDDATARARITQQPAVYRTSAPSTKTSYAGRTFSMIRSRRRSSAF